ncbi:MAG: hypothetical protein QOE22_142 [Candidatus Parcubacteria bacterium]|nr:hypothetical protein [Candidatus Parcubacteria bacterium]
MRRLKPLDVLEIALRACLPLHEERVPGWHRTWGIGEEDPFESMNAVVLAACHGCARYADAHSDPILVRDFLDYMRGGTFRPLAARLAEELVDSPSNVIDIHSSRKHKSVYYTFPPFADYRDTPLLRPTRSTNEILKLASLISSSYERLLRTCYEPSMIRQAIREWEQEDQQAAA